MIYGLYLSATGVVTSSHQQDVIANNLANAETGGFKRQLEIQEQRRVESQVAHATGRSNKMLDNIGGGQDLAPSYTDFSQGELETSSNNFDTAIVGEGFYGVKDSTNEMKFTRTGALMLDNQGNLITTAGQTIVDTKKNPIQLPGYKQHDLTIGPDGTISAGRNALTKIGLFQPADPQSLKPIGRNLFAQAGDKTLAPAKGVIRNGALEHANIDPTTELTRLMETQRLLEANANLIRYQDQSLSKAVNDLGKIS